MNYKHLPQTDLQLSEVSLGSMSLKAGFHENSRIIHQALDLGINFIDTADLYEKGENEILIGKALKGKRDRVFIGSKVGNQWRADGSGWDWNPSKDYILQSVHESLRRLQTDYLDIYLLHGGTIDDPIDETIEAFEALKKAGHIRYYGISSIRPNVIREWVKRSEMSAIMMQYSLLDRRPEEACLDLLHKHQIGVLVRGAVAKGLLVDKPPKDYLSHSATEVAEVQKKLQTFNHSNRNSAQTAIQYVLHHPAVTTAVLGASNLQQLETNAATSESEQLLPPEYEALKNISNIHLYQNHR